MNKIMMPVLVGVLVTLGAGATQAAVVIDDFSVPQAAGTTYTSPGGLGQIMGGVSGATRALSPITDPWHTLVFEISGGTLNYWSFGGFEPWSVTYASPSSISLTGAGLDAFRFDSVTYGPPQDPLVVELSVGDTSNQTSTYTGTLSGTEVTVPFTSFTGNADWTQIGDIKLTGLSGTSYGYYFYFDSLTGSSPDPTVILQQGAHTPEPSTALLLVLGSLTLGGWRWRKREKQLN